MRPPRKLGDRPAPNWNLSSKNSRKIIILLGDLALTNMGLGDKVAALTLAERAMAANPVEKDAMMVPLRSRFSPGWQRSGRARPRHPCYRETSFDPYAGPLAAMPLTPALLRLDPMFDPLLGDPRFQKLASEGSQSATPPAPATPTIPKKHRGAAV